MCRSKLERDGGKRCPKESNPEATAKRNARRRELYQLRKSTPELTHRASLSTPASFLPEEHGFQRAGETRIHNTRWAEVDEESEQELNNLNLAQRKAVNAFTSKAHKWINGALYGKPILGDGSGFGDNKTWAATPEQIVRVVKDLDEAFASVPMKTRIVYRGKRVSGKRFKSLGLTPEEYIQKNYALGSEIVFDGYQSTSLSPSTASHWAENGIIFEMKTSTGMNITHESQWEFEQEVLIPRATRWKVVSVSEKQAFPISEVERENVESAEVIVIQLVEVDDDGQEVTVRRTPPPLTDELLDKAVAK